MIEEREIDLYFGKPVDQREDDLFEQARQKRIDAAMFYECAVKIEADELREAA